MVNGIPILLAQAVKTLSNVTRILASVIAMLSKVLSQCAINRGSDAGLSKEECEEAGGIYVDRKIGDLGIYDGTMPTDDNLRSLLSPDSTLTDEDINEINHVGITSNGTNKVQVVTRFDIDMTECCYCNLCTYPCPEECIYMTGGPNSKKHPIDYEFSEHDRSDLIYRFAKPGTKEGIQKVKSKQGAQS